MPNGCRIPTRVDLASARDEEGFAVATVLLLLVAVFAIVSVGLYVTIQAQSGTVRDQQSKAALTSAEAGVTQALLTYNGGFTPAKDSQGQEIPTCWSPVSNPPDTIQPRSPGPGGWCDAVGPVPSGSG